MTRGLPLLKHNDCGVFSAVEDGMIKCDKCGLYTTASTEFLHTCGCGHAIDIVGEFISALKASIEPEKVCEFIKDNVAREYLFHVLDNGEFVEHGSSVIYSWITDRGRELLSLLEKEYAAG